jgi:hypothetical protein
VLYEMLAGRRAFAGETVWHASVLAARPAAHLNQWQVPPNLSRLVSACLQAIGAASTASDAGARSPPSPRRRRRASCRRGHAALAVIGV